MSSNNRRDSDDRPSDDRNTSTRDERVDYVDTDRRDEHGDSVDSNRRDEHVHADRHDEHDDPDRHEEHVDHEANPGERGKWISALIAVLGLWMIVQAFGVDLTASQFWNDVLVGALLIGVGGYNYSRRSSERFGNMAVALIAVAAGVWLLVAPFVLGAGTGATETANDFGFYNDLVVGLLAIGLGAYSAYKARDHQEDTPRTAT